ncbi:MAG: hypothetical protein RIT35_74 [Pseudomonadota bacterium]|jgi:hypothetical protein
MEKKIVKVKGINRYGVVFSSVLVWAIHIGAFFVVIVSLIRSFGSEHSICDDWSTNCLKNINF